MTWGHKVGDMSNAQSLSIAPLRVGGLALSGRVFLAPMAGVTDAGMRRAAQRRGAPLTFCEMVASSGLMQGDAECVTRAEAAPGGPFAVQLVGCEPGPMAEAARRLEAQGAEWIDVNMGCPASPRRGRARGIGADARRPPPPLSLLGAVVAAVESPGERENAARLGRIQP